MNIEKSSFKKKALKKQQLHNYFIGVSYPIVKKTIIDVLVEFRKNNPYWTLKKIEDTQTVYPTEFEEVKNRLGFN